MSEVMNTQVVSQEGIKEAFNHLLSRYFWCNCVEDKVGNLVCSISVRNLRRPMTPITRLLRVDKRLRSDNGYVVACVEKAVRDIINELGN